MHIERFLHKTLSCVMHKKRLITLSVFVIAALKGKKLSLTNLGRVADLDIQERSAIRRADRFIGNKHLHSERKAICQVFIQKSIGNKGNPKIIVDWSPIPNSKYHVLRASLMLDGRALTLYDEVHPEKKLGNVKIQKGFLSNLKLLLPKQCRPIIVTDAGFHNGWFLDVFKLGWDYIGRVRGIKVYQMKGKEWRSIKTLVSGGTKTPEFIGQAVLCFNNSLITNLYRVKNISKGRKALNLNKERKNDTQSKKHSKSAKEAWVLATSLAHHKYSSAKKIVNIFKKRMQIEEGFRDLKSSRYGFSFEEAFSRKIQRVEILLLIAMLAALIAWMVGYIGEGKELQYQFQANSIKKHRVLSLFYLGCQMLRRKIHFTLSELETAFSSIRNQQIRALSL
jgi:hypothetical protein